MTQKRTREITQPDGKENEQSLRKDDAKSSDVYVTGIPEREERDWNGKPYVEKQGLIIFVKNRSVPDAR